MRVRPLIFLFLILLIFGIFLGWPIEQVVRVGFEGIAAPGKPGVFTFAYVAAVFQDESLRAGLVNSLAIAVMVTVLCVIVTVPLAVLAVRYEFVGKKFASALLLVP